MKHRALIVGAGRIGAGYNWHDDAYTHAGAYRALSDRVELVGFVEPDFDRRIAANLKWSVPTYDTVAFALEALKPDVISVCVQPSEQAGILWQLKNIKGVWCEKPYVSPPPEKLGLPIQVNYLRRGDARHRAIADRNNVGRNLVVYAKDDIHTRCHFEDLAKWWNVPLHYHSLREGPCSYLLGSNVFSYEAFPMGGVDGGPCMEAMLKNLLDHIDKGVPLWSPAN